MDRQKTFELIKDDLNNLKNAEFNSVSASSAYGYMFKVVFGVMISLSLIHIMSDFLHGYLGNLCTKDVFMHWITVMTGFAFSGFIIFFFTKSIFIMHEQFKSTLKSKHLLYQLKRNVKLFFLITFGICAYFLPFGHFASLDVSGCDPWVSFEVIPPVILTAFFLSFELERLGVGPLLEAISEAYKRITGVPS